MSITKTIIATIAAIALVAVVAPAGANALTTAELQAQINALMAQLSSLQGTTTTTTVGSVPAACAGITFTRNLTVGSTGADVKCLQALLNSNGYTVATTGAGSPGNETTTFGPKTLVAVKAFQVAQGFTPAAQVGPMTRAKLNAMLAGTTVTPVTPGIPPVVTPTGAGLTAMLSTDNPASVAVVSNAALVPLAKITFVNGDNAQVKVTGVKLQRIGVSADASLNNVYLFDGANRLTDAASVSTGVITFNDSTGLFTIDANNSKTITVYSDLAASAGETLGVALTAAFNVTSNASSVKGNFPLNGNLMTVATATLAGVNFNSSTTPSTASVNPQKDLVVWENLTSITTREVSLSWLRLREIGTINYSDVNNYRLYVDGVQVGTAVANLDANGYVTFDLTSAPAKLQTGTRDIKVLADVIGGSNRTFSFSLRVASDVNVKDTQYGANVLAQRASAAFTAATTGTQTINSGTVTVQKTTDSPAGNVVNSASNQVLGRFTITAAGERVKIDTIKAAVICPTGTTNLGLRNGALFANGVQIGSTATLNCTTNATLGYTSYSVGSSLIVDPATPVTLEVRADIYATGSVALASTNTLQVQLLAGSSNGQGQTSLTTSNVPASTVSANQVTVKTGSLTLSKYTAYTNSYAVVPLTNFKLSHFTLTNDTVEAVNLSSIKVTLNYVSGNTTNLYVKFGTQETTKTTTVSAASTTYSVNYQLQPSQTIDVAVYADVDANAVGIATSGVYVTGTTVSSATAVTAGTDANATTGQTITFTTGSVTTAVDDATPLSSAVAGNQTVTAAKFKITAANDSYTIQEARFTVQGNNGDIILNATLQDGTCGTGSNPSCPTMPFDSTNNRFTFTGLTVPVAANTSKVLTLQYSLSTPSADYGSNGENAQATLSYVKVANSQGVTSEPTASRAGNYLYVYKTIPTFTVGTIPSGQTLSGTTSLYDFKVSADSKGAVYLKQLKFNVTIADAGTTSNPALSAFQIYRGSDVIPAAIIGGTSDITGSTTIGAGSNTVVVTFNTQETVPAGSTYEYVLKATATAGTFTQSTTGNDSVSVSLLGDTTPFGVSAGADASKLYLDATSNTAIQGLYATAGHVTSPLATAAPSIIWSDGSALGHDYTYSASSNDWLNGYLIKNLPLDSISITK